jgi:hypothetical protein
MSDNTNLSDAPTTRHLGRFVASFSAESAAVADILLPAIRIPASSNPAGRVPRTAVFSDRSAASTHRFFAVASGMNNFCGSISMKPQ